MFDVFIYALFVGFGAQMTEAIKGATFSVVYTFVDDDVAVVKIKQEGGERPGESYYDAKKVDGQWKIAVNKEAHEDYRCISRRSINECLEAFKAEVLKQGDQKSREMFFAEGLATVQEVVAKIPPEELSKMPEFFGKIRFEGYKKSILHDDAIEVKFKTPEGADLKLTLKNIDGKWKIFSM